MAGLRKNTTGFSLTEVLLAVGILSVGMTFIAGVFPVAIHLTTVATERTIAAVAADEAFAKVQFCGVDLTPLTPLTDNALTDFNNALPSGHSIKPNEFAYPSAADPVQKQYFWSALCRLTDANNPNPPVQVTVFVSRKVSPNLQYPKPPNGSGTIDHPMPVKVGVSGTNGNNELTIDAGKKTFINDGYTIVDDVTGRIYRVLERYKGTDDDTILLNENWQGTPNAVWVVPPPVTGGRNPCIAVYQKTILF